MQYRLGVVSPPTPRTSHVVIAPSSTARFYSDSHSSINLRACYLLSLTKPTPLSTITQVTRDCARSPSPPRASHVSAQIFASSLALNYRRQNICTVGLVSFLLVLHRLCMRAFGTRQLFETQQVSFRTRNQWSCLILADIPPDGRAHNIDRMHEEAC